MTYRFVKKEKLFACADSFEPFRCCVNFESHMLVEMKLHCETDHSVPELEEKHHKCKNCDFGTFSKFLLLIHQSNLCLKNVETKSQNPPFNAKKNTRKNKSFKCDYCSHTTKRAYHLRQHVLSRHTDPEKIQWLECAHCPFKTKLPSNLNSHMKYKHANKKLEFEFDRCSYTTDRTHNSKDHHLCIHTDPEKIQWFECVHCPFKTKLKGSLVSHMKHVHQRKSTTNAKKKVKFKCDHCLHTTTSVSNLRVHVLRKHTSADEIQWLRCGHCPFATKTATSLKLHVLRRHTNRDKVQWFKCAQCPYKGKTKSDVKLHFVYKHGDKKPVKCDQCPFATKRKLSLRRHVLNKHTQPKSKLLECAYCPYATTMAGTLREHVLGKHTDPDIVQWFECGHCHYKNLTKSGLNRHITFKHGERPTAKCDQCSFASKQTARLRKHVIAEHTNPEKVE